MALQIAGGKEGALQTATEVRITGGAARSKALTPQSRSSLRSSVVKNVAVSFARRSSAMCSNTAAFVSNCAASHRRILDEYNPYLLDQMIGVVTASTLMAYIIYCTSADTVERFGTHNLVLTIPFPIYGILRYLYLVHRRDGGGNPAPRRGPSGPAPTVLRPY